jgi:exodeoxyribonuclease VII small subunit
MPCASMEPQDGNGASAAPEDTMPLEAILKRLDEVVLQLEKGDLALEESLRVFEEGVRLTRAGQRRLDAAEKRVDQLVTNEGGDTVLQPMPRG